MQISKRDQNGIFDQFNREFSQMLKTMNNRWVNLIDEDSNVVTSEWAPAVDIVEEDDKFIVYADIPGVDSKDISVAMENGMLSIKGSRTYSRKDHKNGYLRAECAQGMFYRRLGLPENVDPEKITAKAKDGVLTITLAKRHGTQPKLIKIES